MLNIVIAYPLLTFLEAVLSIVFLFVTYVYYQRMKHDRTYHGDVVKYQTQRSLKGFFKGYYADGAESEHIFDKLAHISNTECHNVKPFVARYLLHSTRIVITNPQDTAFILNHTHIFVKNRARYFFLEHLLGKNLVTMLDPKEHARHRKAMVPAFSGCALKTMAQPVMGTHIHRLLSQWEAELVTAEASGEVLRLPMQEQFDAVAMSIVVSAAFKTDITKGVAAKGGDVPSEKNMMVHELFSKLMGIASTNWTFLIPNGHKLPVAINRKQEVCRTELQNRARQIIQRATDSTASSEEGKKDGQNVEHMLADAQTLLDYLVENPEFTQDDIVNHCLIFLFAGHETSSRCMTWTTYLLATHPEVQEKLAEEVAVHVSPGAIPSDALKRECPYLMWVVYESLRLYPPVPFTFRDTNERVVLPGSGVEVCPGAVIALSPYVMHQNKSVWGDDADMFRPERWADIDVSAAQRQGIFIPFLIGMRNCIGREFALQEVAMCIASVVRSYRLAWVEGAPLPKRHAAITLRPDYPFQLEITRRCASD
eukprot:PhM_4_TR7579/c0_g1_i1/m.20568